MEDSQVALKMMSRNRGGYRCWGCREEGHDLYNCPYLSYEVRMLFAKANYDYQSEPRGPAVADQHFRMRGYPPSRGYDGRGHSPSRGRKYYDTPPPSKNVSDSVPTVLAKPPTREEAQMPRSERKGKTVMFAEPSKAAPLQPHDSSSEITSSTSTGN